MSALIFIPLAIAAILAICVLALLPFGILSWPQRVRWIVASQAMSVAGGGVVPAAPLDLREVTLLSLDDHGGDLELEVLECGRSAVDIITFATTHPTTTEIVSMLGEWCALGVPMLLFVDTNSSSLHGPTASIGDLRRVPSRRSGLV